MQKPTNVPSTASFSRRRFLTATGGLVGVSALAACVPGERGTAPTATVPNVPETTADVYQVSGFPPFASGPTMLEVVEDRGETVIVRHLFGETEIPKNPQRVVTDATAIQVAWMLDLPVVLTDYYPAAADLPNFTSQTEDIIAFETTYTIPFEQLVEADPDLILMYANVVWSSEDPETLYNLLSEIAPTVIFLASPADYWQQASIDLANALEIEGVEEYVQGAFYADVEAACKPLNDAIGEETVIYVDIFNDLIWLNGVGWMDEERFANNGVSAPFYRWCQLNPPDFLSDLVGTEFNVELSQELIPELQAEHLFISYGGDTGEQTYDDLLTNPLWQTVPAVINDNVYLMPSTAGHGAEGVLYAIQTATEAVTKYPN